MTVPAVEALQQALALIQAPRGARPGAEDRLPEGMFLLLKLVAGEEQAGLEARAASRQPLTALREAAGFYIQQVMFAPEADSYRVLGVEADAPDERIREHYRWLARWLHPDRNPDEWEVVYADRVNQAWQDLRTAERRERYDQTRHLARSPDLGDWIAPAADAKPKVSAHYDSASVSTQSNYVRWLPHAVLGGLGLAAVALVALFSVVRWSEPPPSPAQSADELAIVDEPVPMPSASPQVLKAQSPVVPPQPVQPVPESISEAAVVVPPAPAISAQSQPVMPVAAQPLPAPPPVREEVVLSAPRVAVAKAPPLGRKPPNEAAVAAAVPPLPQKKVEPILRPPVASAAGVSVAAEAIAELDQADANRLLSHFSRAYEDGNVASMRSLFAHDAHAARGNREAVLAGYDRLFGSSSARTLQLRDVSWFTTGDTLTIIASFEATVTSSRGGRPRRTRGDLRLDLLREDAQWRIVRLQHDERPG